MANFKIKDIVVAAFPKNEKNPIGEAGNSQAAEKKMSLIARTQMLERLWKGISNLIELAKADHLENYRKSNNTNLDYITRLSTNEFFFYTLEPLTLTEFEKIQNAIHSKMKDLPPGIQLVLGSFAVKTAHNQIVNVTPYVNSRPFPSFKFIVKNFTSAIDVRYKEKNLDGVTETLKQFDKRNYTGVMPKINIHGIPHEFTFDNIILSKTPQGQLFITVIDICLDHFYKVGVTNIMNFIGEKNSVALLNSAVSHMVISNVIDLNPLNSLGEVVHVDPLHSHQKCKENTKQIMREKEKTPHFFGKDEVKIYDIIPSPCKILIEALLNMGIKSLEKLKFGIDDKPIIQCIKKYQDMLNNSLIPPKEKYFAFNELNTLVTELKNNEANNVIRSIIAQFRERAGFFSIKMNVKAGKIEDAMSKLSIEDRLNFIQASSNKDVLNALAFHRNLKGRKSTTSLNKFNAIFYPDSSKDRNEREEAKSNIELKK